MRAQLQKCVVTELICKRRTSEKPKSKNKRRWRRDLYWQQEMAGILLEFGATALPDLSFSDDDSGKKVLVASRVRLKYVVRRVRVLKKGYVGRQLDERVHGFLDQARLQTDGAYWRELDQEFHTRNVFML